MLIAVVSDIHGNLPAFEAVLRDADSNGVDQVSCLGDIVGYGGQPKECLEMIRMVGTPIVRGNHDTDVALDFSLKDYYHPLVRRSIELTRSILSVDEKAYLVKLPLVAEMLNTQIVHASLKNPQDWIYLDNPKSAEDHFSLQKTDVTFCGHTHIPGGFYKNINPGLASVPSSTFLIDLNKPIEVNGYSNYLINTGSVGQPRDGDPRASYVLFESNSGLITFRRVEYNIEKAQKKILHNGFPASFASRLSVGL